MTSRIFFQTLPLLVYLVNQAGNPVVFSASLYRQSDGKIDTDTLSMGPESYDLMDAAQNNDASYEMWQLNQNNGLSTTEAAGMRLWGDANENGLLDANELQGVGASLAAPALPAAPGYAGVPGIERSMPKALRGGQALPQALPVVPNISSANETNWRQAA